MLSVFLACEDPYETADFFTGALGWRAVFATPRDCGDRLAVVGLGDGEVMLSTADEEYLPERSREHRGAGVTVYVNLPPDVDIAEVHARHAAAGVVTRPLTERPWGERAFDAVIAGYRFLIAQDPADAAEPEDARDPADGRDPEEVRDPQDARDPEAARRPGEEPPPTR